MMKKLLEKYLLAKEKYYNDQPIMSDEEFDALEDKIRAYDPDWVELKKTGVKTKKTEVVLEHFMPSLNKVYPEKVEAWLAKWQGPKLVMDKLDGGSLQLTYKNGSPYD